MSYRDRQSDRDTYTDTHQETEIGRLCNRILSELVLWLQEELVQTVRKSVTGSVPVKADSALTLHSLQLVTSVNVMLTTRGVTAWYLSGHHAQHRGGPPQFVALATVPRRKASTQTAIKQRASATAG